MLPPKQTLHPAQRELLALFRQLDERQQETLIDFARFLSRRGESDSADAATPPAQPLGLPRPENETVVAAIRRLARNYPMLNKDTLLHQASALMTAHVLHGRGAVEVIDELEELFAGAYKALSGDDD